MQFNPHQRENAPSSPPESDEDVEVFRRRIDALEAQVSKLVTERDVLDAELNAVRKAVVAERLAARDYVEALRTDLSDLEVLKEAYAALAKSTEDEISVLQVEAAELATLIDVVQNSHFWKLKRMARRVSAMFRR